MKEPFKTKQALIQELASLRQRITELEQSESGRKLAEEALRVSEELFRSYLEYAPDGVYMSDLEGNFLYGNLKCEEIIGYRREELIGKNLLELNILPEKYLNKAAQLLQVNMQGKSTGPDEIDLISKKGRLIPVEINTNVVQRMGQRIVLSFVRDISERKQAEEKLKQSEERYRSIFENAQEGIYRSTPEGKVIMANQAMAKMFGYESPEEMITGVTDVARQHYVNPEDRRILKEMIEEHGFIKGYEAQNYRKDGSIIWISRTMHAVRDEKGQIIYYDGIIEDITSRKQKVERIRKALGATVHAIAVTVETRDPYTAGHQRRVADLARAIATEMNLSVDQIDGIRMAATIHDLGKISVPAEILSKPTKLTNIEFRLIKTHSQSGYDILKDIDFPWPVARTVLEHHERMNGSGYPNGLTGDHILLESRILAVADVVESMASHRPYRPALGIKAALEEIEKNRGTLYDNAVADACLNLFRERGYQLQ
jgi:PAS domain S-box-containing protein